MKLLLATNNKGKLEELNRMLDQTGIEVISPAEAGLPPGFDVEETGLTFKENAILKARGFAQAARMYALADDSGLEVAALGGEPGVYSKRYAGENASDSDRINFLLSKLAAVPDEERQAQFVAAVALSAPDGQILKTETGTCKGYVIRSPRGSNGFGYDPIFVPLAGNGRTLAELTDREKDAISHRGNAFRQIIPAILSLPENKTS